MKKLLIAALTLVCAVSLSVVAQDAPKKKELTDDQKAVKKEMLGKYDTNKDGKLSKEEHAKMTDEDKAKWDKAGLGGGGKKKPATAPDASNK